MAKRSRKRRQWGKGQVVPPKTPGGLWGVRWTLGGRRAYVGGLACEADAAAYLDKLAGDRVCQRLELPQSPRRTPKLGSHVEGFFKGRELLGRRTVDEDRGRWRNHLEPWFGSMRPAEVDVALIRKFVEDMLDKEMCGSTVRILVSLMSMLYELLKEDGTVKFNPFRGLPGSIRSALKSDHDPKTVPFIESCGDIERIFLDRYTEGATEVAFARADIVTTAAALAIVVVLVLLPVTMNEA